MAAYRLRHFVRAEILRTIAPERLLTFLKTYRRFFNSRGVALPLPGSAAGIDYEALVTVFMSPDRKTPADLIVALHLVDEMSTPEGMDALLAEAARHGLPLDAGADHSPADVAVQMWMLNKDVLERKHAEQFAFRPRSYEYFQTDRCPVPPFQSPSAMRLRLLERALDDWFEARKRGRGSRVFVFEREDAVWFVVRHGDPFRREESLNGAEASNVCFRPSKHDVLAYHPEAGELRVNARSKGEKELYRAAFGAYLFGAEDFFPGTEKYSLTPLRTSGEASLSCVDIDGIEAISLKEVQLLYPGNPWEIVTRKSANLFALLKARGRDFPETGRLLRATFQVTFADSKTPRTVVIRPSNIAQFTRDGDSVHVEAWLKARGFIVQRGNEEGGPDDPFLAND